MTEQLMGRGPEAARNLALVTYGLLFAAIFFAGVPALIGWENHELVWRGHGVVEETSRRATLVRELYSCGDPARVREIATGEGIPLVAIGSLERADFAEESLAAVRAAGELVLDEAGGQVVRVDGGAPAAAEVNDG